MQATNETLSFSEAWNLNESWNLQGAIIWASAEIIWRTEEDAEWHWALYLTKVSETGQFLLQGSLRMQQEEGDPLETQNFKV